MKNHTTEFFSYMKHLIKKFNNNGDFRNIFVKKGAEEADFLTFSLTTFELYKKGKLNVIQELIKKCTSPNCKNVNTYLNNFNKLYKEYSGQEGVVEKLLN